MVQRIRGKQVFETIFCNPPIGNGSGALSNAFPLVMADPRYASLFWDDFTQWHTGTAAADSPWTITLTGAGTVAQNNMPGGWIDIASAAADNDSVEMQTIGEPFTLAAAKPLWFECKFKVDDADLVAIFVGLAKLDVTFLDTVNDCAGFLVPLARATGVVDFSSVKVAVATTVAGVVTLADLVAVTVGMYWDGTTLFPYVNGVQKTPVTVPVAVPVAPTICLQNESAVIRHMYVDYIMCIQAR